MTKCARKPCKKRSDDPGRDRWVEVRMAYPGGISSRLYCSSCAQMFQDMMAEKGRQPILRTVPK